MTRNITVPDQREHFTYVEAPDDFSEINPLQPSIFLAGGITNCHNWQNEALRRIMLSLLNRQDGKSATIYNPRRENFPASETEQIEWEFRALTRASVVLFWFLDAPSDHYELGRYGATKRIVVGADLDYVRRLDVVEQMRHARPLLTIRDNLDDTVDDALKAIHRYE